MFAPREFPAKAWMSVLDTDRMQVIVMPLEITGVDGAPEFYRCSDTDAPIHYMSGGLVEAKASLDTLLVIQKAKATK